MTFIRLKSSSFYFRLSDHEKKCYNAGLPIRYTSKNIHDLTFAPYLIGERKRVTAQRQEDGLSNFITKLHVNSGFNGIMAFHSAPTDEAAFQAAASIFESAIERGFACRCLSTSQLLAKDPIGACDVYLVHGVNDLPNPQVIWALRDFMRDRDGSLRMLVMTSGKELALDVLIHEQLRMHCDFLFCLQDEASTIEADYRAKPVSASGTIPKPSNAYRRVRT
jgi:hypothetical protein